MQKLIYYLGLIAHLVDMVILDASVGSRALWNNLPPETMFPPEAY